MHLIGQNKQSKFICNTLRISPITMTCAELCCQTTWGHISQVFAKCGPERRHLRRVKVPNVAKKLGFRACIWLAGANSQQWVQYFPYFHCKNDLCGAILGNIFLNVVSNLSFGGGNWVLCLWYQPISKMGYFKCSILFNMCTIWIHFYLVNFCQLTAEKKSVGQGNHARVHTFFKSPKLHFWCPLFEK